MSNEKQQRKSFIQWYESNVGKKNAASTISVAIGKASLKNGKALFAISSYDELALVIKNSGLDGYFQKDGGDYSKMDAVFDIAPNCQKDDLKSGIKYYLAFLKNFNEVASPQQARCKSINFPLNQILYGPLGTGKTYNTVEMAVKIIEGDNAPSEWEELKKRYDEYVSRKQIFMVTFHQSYAYEDFIEGITATTKDGGIFYEPKSGIFKEICGYASSAGSDGNIGKRYSLDGRSIWKMSLGDTSKREDDQIYQDCIEKGYIVLGYGDRVNYTGAKTIDEIKERYGKYLEKDISSSDYAVTAVNMLINKIKKGDIIIISDGNHKFRAIAEVIGDYQYLPDIAPDNPDYYHCREVKWLKTLDGSAPKEEIFDKGISQMTLYNAEKSINKDRLQYYINTKFEKKPYVLIIDEINRGNVSRIFGELITLIEDSKRKGMSDERSVTLPYTQEQLFVPDNLYIIGTMNTADRSLTSIDLALRRRFTFIDTPPLPKELEDIEVYGVNIAALLDAINARIEALIDKDHCIGHCYFLPLENAQDKEAMLADIFKNKILPLLQEYFYGDWEAIRKVLNGQFIAKKDVKLMEEASTVYHISNAAYHEPQSYQGIVRS